jgi:hypothetical protein
MRLTDKTMFDLIIDTTLLYFKPSTRDEVLSRSRKAEFKEPRQIICALAYKFTGNAQQAVGDYVGGINHATINHATGVVIEHYDMEKDYAEIVDSIISLINHKTRRNYTFQMVREKKKKTDKKYLYQNELLMEFDNKIQEILLSFHDETILEAVKELKEIDFKINNLIHTKEVLNETASTQNH